MRHARPMILCFACLAGCAQFPELDAVQDPAVAEADFPALLPLDGLLDAPAPRATPEVAEDVGARVAGLRARAAGLRGDVIGAAARSRMARGVRRP